MVGSRKPGNMNSLRLLAEQRAVQEIHLESLKKELGHRRVRVLFATLLLTAGGIEKSLYHLISGLDRHVFEPEIHTVWGGKWVSLFETICPVHAGEPIDSLAEREGFDLIHINNVDGIYPLHSKYPLVETVYGIGGLFLKEVDKMCLKRLIFCDERCKNFFVPLIIIGKERVQVLNNPVNVDYQPNHGKLRKLLKIADARKLIGWVARISPEKNVDLFLDTAELLGNRYEWVVIGEGWRPEVNLEFIKKLQKLDVKVHWIRDVDRLEIMDYISDMDLLTLTSYTEGQSIALLEAMVVKTPVIATNVGGLPSIVIEGKTGFMIQSHTPNHMASIIRKSLKHGRDLVDMAYAHVLLNHNVKDYVRNMETVYLESFLNRSKGGE